MKCHVQVSALGAGGVQLLKCLSWEDVCTSSAHPQVLHGFCAMSIKNSAGFLLLGYSPVILTQDEFLQSNWDQVLQCFRNMCSMFCFPLHFSYLNILEGFFPLCSSVLVKLEVCVIVTIDFFSWKKSFLDPPRLPYASLLVFHGSLATV